MKIMLNDLPLELDQSMTLAVLFTEYHYPASDTALAVNQIIIPRWQWADYRVQDGDNVLLFQAIAGG
ncbi:MAG: sulfur carrier protein ThiS [Sodalis sp. (in: enterobacteria)]